MTKYPGIPVTLNGTTYVLPSLLADHVIRFDEEGIWSGQQVSSGKFLLQVIRVLHAALSRNYPELTEEDLRQIEPRELFAAFPVVTEATMGKRKTEKGEALGPATSGESSGSSQAA
jgi:hypothetical protein